MADLSQCGNSNPDGSLLANDPRQGNPYRLARYIAPGVSFSGVNFTMTISRHDVSFAVLLELRQWLARLLLVLAIVAMRNEPCSATEPPVSGAADPFLALLDATQAMDDASFCDVVKGIRKGIRGRSVASPQSLPAWVENAKARSTQAWTEALLLGISLGDKTSLAEAESILASRADDVSLWTAVARPMAERRAANVTKHFIAALENESLRRTSIRALSRYDDAMIADSVLAGFGDWSWEDCNEGLQLLASRPASATRLCQEIASGSLDRNRVPAFILRQLRSLNDPEVNRHVSELWGNHRSTPGEKKKLIRRLQNLLVSQVLDQADLERGQLLSKRLCLTCHQLHGVGKQIGPDLTGAQRGDLHYMLHNIIHPSAQIDPSMQLTVVDLKSGRTHTGIILRENESSIELQTATEKQTLSKSDIETRTVSDQSMMPEGILDALSKEEIQDLIGYLMHDKRAKVDE